MGSRVILCQIFHILGQVNNLVPMWVLHYRIVCIKSLGSTVVSLACLRRVTFEFGFQLKPVNKISTKHSFLKLSFFSLRTVTCTIKA